MNEAIFTITYAKNGMINQKVVFDQESCDIAQSQLLALGYQIIHVEESH